MLCYSEMNENLVVRSTKMFFNQNLNSILLYTISLPHEVVMVRWFLKYIVAIGMHNVEVLPIVKH